MELSHAKAPVRDDIEKAFGVLDWDNIAIAYGKTIYTKQYILSPHLYLHELTHSEQQGDNPKGWWKRYLEDKHFRLSQEIEAYQVQVKWIKENIKDRNEKVRIIHKLAGDLSGAMYGNVISRNAAWRLLK